MQYQGALYAQAIILTDSTSLVSIGKQMDIFEDHGGKLSLQQILTPAYQAKFKKSTRQVPNFGTKQTSGMVQDTSKKYF